MAGFNPTRFLPLCARAVQQTAGYAYPTQNKADALPRERIENDKYEFTKPTARGDSWDISEGSYERRRRFGVI